MKTIKRFLGVSLIAMILFCGCRGPGGRHGPPGMREVMVEIPDRTPTPTPHSR